MSVAKSVLQHLITTEEYARQVFPFLTTEYFKESVDRALFGIITGYVTKYSKFPSVEEVGLELVDNSTLSDIEFDEAKEFLCDLTPADVNFTWLVDKTEQFCKDRALELAIQKAVSIITDEKNSSLKREAIPNLLQDALAVSFNVSLGHDYLEDWEARYDFLHTTVSRIPFHLEYFNRITGGGIPPKTLSVILAGTGVGKSMLMGDMAAHNMMDGKNVLYITLEMAEERISERIDANLMDIELSLMDTTSKKIFGDKIERIKRKTTGKLIIEEFAPSTVGASHFRHLLDELRIKKKFVPDIVYIDYINLCLSTRYKNLTNANSYTVVKMIAEELRGIAVSYNIPIVTATQTTRAGHSSTDLDLEDTAESFGLPATADFMIAVSQDEDLEKLGQVQFKQLKNRFRDKNVERKYNMGVQRPFMRFFELDPSAQPKLNTDKPKDRFTPASKKDRFDKFNKRN